MNPDKCSNLHKSYALISELSKLKVVFRNTKTQMDRKESTAEHSWSASMIVMILRDELKQEFTQIDELKIIKLVLIHDIVEIYAGDVMVFDREARKNKAAEEIAALEQLKNLYPDFGHQLNDLWYEFEAKETLEAKIAKAADAICPIFQRLHVKQSYISINISLDQLNQTKQPLFEFSQTFLTLYENLKNDLLNEQLI